MSRARWIAAALLAVFSVSVIHVSAQNTAPPKPAAATTPTPTTFPWEGEVTGTNVRVRSGAGTTWYATCKVNTGDRLLVLAEQSGWFQIAPPAGSFSYIDAADVTREPGAKTGLVRRDGVSVKAGSELAQSKSSPQVVMSKGAVVEILGEKDGFFKIIPPPGAVLFITKEYVRPVAPAMRTGLAERHAVMRRARPVVEQTPAVATPTNTPAANGTPAGDNGMKTAPQPMGAGSVDPVAGNNAADGGSRNEPAVEEIENMEGAEPSLGDDTDAARETPLEADASIQALRNNTTPSGEAKKDAPGSASMNKASGRYQAMLTMVESDANATMLLPLEQRDLDSLIKRYQEIANQTDERVPAEYSKIRVGQLEAMAGLRKAQAESATKSSEMDAFSSRMTEQRMQFMKARMEKVTEKFDFVGELRKSYAFAPEKRRYRLVDPKRQTTIAYVDIPRDITENAEFMIGRTVGIRTSGQRYSMAARIPIAVVASITDLTPSTNAPGNAPADVPQGMTGESTDDGAKPETLHIMPPPLEPAEKKPAKAIENPGSGEKSAERKSAAKGDYDGGTA